MKAVLPDSKIPKRWYNILPDLPEPLAPPLDPETDEPMEPEKLLRIFAAELFAKTEGIIPAPESAHAIKGAIERALKAKEERKEEVILFNLSGHGFLDLGGYEDYLNGKLEDYEPDYFPALEG